MHIILAKRCWKWIDHVTKKKRQKLTSLLKQSCYGCSIKEKLTNVNLVKKCRIQDEQQSTQYKERLQAMKNGENLLLPWKMLQVILGCDHHVVYYQRAKMVGHKVRFTITTVSINICYITEILGSNLHHIIYTAAVTEREN